MTTPNPPTAPTGVGASAAETGLLVSLTWTDNTNNETSYKVQRCTGTNCTPTSNLVTGLAVNSTSYSDTTTARNTTYGYRACAVNDVSATCSATTYVPTPSGLPAAPSNVVAEAAPNGLAITLTWDDNATTETSYSVQRCQGANCVPTAFVTGLAANSVFYTDTTTNLNITYGYSVCAINAVGSRCSTPTTYVTTSPVVAHTHYYISDHLGSTTLLVSSAGVIEAESEYYPYGGERVFVPDSTGNAYKFTGKERDAETGLDYFGARYFASNMGRWMPPDWSAAPVPVPYARLVDPQSLNLYSYVGNDPSTRFDADGHFQIRHFPDDNAFHEFEQLAEKAAAEIRAAEQRSGRILCGFWCGLGQRIKNGFTGRGFKTNEQLLPKGTVTTSQTFWLRSPDFYSATVTAGVVTHSVTYVPKTDNFYFAAGGGGGTGAAVTAGWSTNADGYSSGPSFSGCYFYGFGGCGGASTSGDVAIQVGIGGGGWGGSGTYGMNPVDAIFRPMVESIPVDPNLSTPIAFGVTTEDIVGTPQ